MIESVRRTFTKLGRKTLRSSKDLDRQHSGHVKSGNVSLTDDTRSSTLRSELDTSNDSPMTVELESKAVAELTADRERLAELDSCKTSPSVPKNRPLDRAGAGPLSRCWEGPWVPPNHYTGDSSTCVSPCSAIDLNSQPLRYSVVSELDDTAIRFNVSQSTGYSKESTFNEPWSSQAISTYSSPRSTTSQVVIYPSHEYKKTPYSGGEEVSRGKPRLSDSELCSSPSSYLPDTTSGDHDAFFSAGTSRVSTFGDPARPEKSQTASRANTNYMSQPASGQSSTAPTSAQHSDKEVMPEEAYRVYEQSSTRSHDPHSVLCQCHNRPMLPTLFWPLPQHVLDGTTGQNNALRSRNKTRLHMDMKDIFEFIVKLSYERMGSLGYDMQQSIAPAFQQRPALESSLAALCALVGGAEPCAIGELVSLLYLAFTILMLSVDELDRDRYTEALFLHATSWIGTLKSDYDQRAFEMMLDIVWLPAALANFGSRECHWSVSTLKSACPSTRPLAPIEESLFRNFLDNEKPSSYGMRTGIVARMCQGYIDCLYDSCEAESTSSRSIQAGKLQSTRSLQFSAALEEDLLHPYRPRSSFPSMNSLLHNTITKVDAGDLTDYENFKRHLALDEIQNVTSGLDLKNIQVLRSLCNGAEAIFASRKVRYVKDYFLRAAQRVVSEPCAPAYRRRASDTSGIGTIIHSQSPASRLPAAQSSRAQHRVLSGGIRRQRKTLHRSKRRKSSSNTNEIWREDPEITYCPLCNEAFQGSSSDRRTNLKRHKDQKHLGRTWSCPTCHQDFPRSDYMLEHRRKLHGYSTP